MAADYRKRLKDMSPEEKADVAPSADNFATVFGDRTDTPLSVKGADEAISIATPIDSIVEIKQELEKEEPDYLKIGMLGGIEALGLVGPGIAPAARTMIRKGADLAKQTDEAVAVTSNIPKVSRAAKEPFKKTVKAYKLFTKGEDGKLYPLFVDADTEVPVGQYMKAVFPEYRFKAANGNWYVPSRGTAGKKGTGDSIPIPDQETRDMLIEAGFLKEGSKAKSVKAVAARPGWHAGDAPTAAHIGPEIKIDGKSYKIRGEDQVWAEVEMPADVDWQAIANSRAALKKDGTPNVKTAHITDELPEGGYYRYKTNPNMQGNWLISGDMKVNRILDRDEVKKLNAEAGVEDLPTEAELREQIGTGYASGGLVGAEMYQGVDDYQLAEMGAAMKDGGVVDKQMNAVFKSNRSGYALGGAVPDNTVGIDPVSGNEIPTGSLPEEVRDDIPAQLSEGEYVVPADVVRYYGVKFFEDLRSQAKMGWSEMEQNGRVGGEPMAPEGMEMGGDDFPFSLEELQVVEAAEGGYMRGYAEGGDVELNLPAAPGGIGGGMEYRKYDNAEGNVITIMFFNGNPMSAIPEGYFPLGTVPKEETAETTKGGGRDDDGPRMPKTAAVDYKSLSVDDLKGMVESQTGMSKTAITTGLAFLNPLAGLAVKAAMAHQANQVEQELERRLADPELDPATRTEIQNLLEISQKEKPSLIERIFGSGEEEEEQATDDLEQADATTEPEKDGTYTPEVEAPKDPEINWDAFNVEPVTVGPLDPTDPITLEPITVTGPPESTVQQVNPGFSAPSSEKFNTAGQGDSPTPMTDAFGSGNTFTSGSSSSGGGNSAMERVQEMMAKQKEDASRVAKEVDKGTERIIEKAYKDLATEDEVESIRRESDRIKANLESTARGGKMGFKDGGLVKRRKKK